MKILKSILTYLVKLFPATWLEYLVKHIISIKVSSLPPDEALRFLFRLDSLLYSLQGESSVAYGGGTHTKHRHMRYHDFFVDHVSAGEKVLDVGCGNGAVAYDVAQKAGAHVVGIDKSEANIQIANEQNRHPDVRYVVGDALESMPDDSFDVIILSNVLEHLPARPRFLKRIMKGTNARRILIRIPMFERDWRVPLKKELGLEWRLDNTHETEYTLESFAEEIKEAGLMIAKQEIRWGEIWAEVK